MRPASHSPKVIGPLTVDPWLRLVTLHDEPVTLTRKEYALLMVLASDPSRAFSKDELYRIVWGWPDEPPSRTLDAHAHRLRRKLTAHGDEFVFTVWGHGYRLCDPVSGGWNAVDAALVESLA